MTISNPPKAFILLVALICVTALMALERIDTNSGMPVLTAIVFYGIGYGVAAKTGKASEPIITPKSND